MAVATTSRTAALRGSMEPFLSFFNGSLTASDDMVTKCMAGFERALDAAG